MRSTDHREIGGYKVIALVMTRTAQIHRGEKLPFVVLLDRSSTRSPDYMTARWDGESESWHAGEYDLDPAEAIESMTRRSGQDCQWITQLIKALAA
jgi:hypothetical protein